MVAYYQIAGKQVGSHVVCFVLAVDLWWCGGLPWSEVGWYHIHIPRRHTNTTTTTTATVAERNYRSRNWDV